MIFFCKHVMKALISLLDKEMNVRLVSTYIKSYDNNYTQQGIIILLMGACVKPLKPWPGQQYMSVRSLQLSLCISTGLKMCTKERK